VDMSEKDDPTEVVKIRLSSQTKKKIQEKAEKEYRSFSKQCQMILDEWSNNDSSALQKE
jgi:hypothetical protein